jgi:hypothetical protein
MLDPVEAKRNTPSLNLHGPTTRLKRRFVIRPRNLDIRGLGAKLCELLGVRSGDTIEFHILQDGSVRVVNHGTDDLQSFPYPAIQTR